MYLLKRFFILEIFLAILTLSFIFYVKQRWKNVWKSIVIVFWRLHCSNRTKRRLDAAVIIIEFFMSKNSCKISASLICF